MDRFLNPPSPPLHAEGELARALGIGERRASLRPAPARRGPSRRSSMQPVLPPLGGPTDLAELRRHSMPAAPAAAPSARAAYSENAAPHLPLRPRPVTPAYAGAISGGSGARSGGSRARCGGPHKAGAKQLRLTGVVGMPGLREDYYSTSIASACSAYAPDGEDWAFVHDAKFEQCDEDLLSLNRLGEVLLATPLFACRWTPQLGPQLFRHHSRGDVTCVAMTRLGFCAIGDAEGHILVFDMVRDPPRLLLRQRLTDVVNLHGHNHASSPGAAKHYATHLIWSDWTPQTQKRELARCGYRVELFVGTSRGTICKLWVDAQLRLVVDSVVPPHLAHHGAITSMAFDYNQDTLVVAGIDCELSVWLHYASRAPATLKLQRRLRQPSAIKGMAFCPGLDHLLAVGGGRRDRVLRVYDTQQGKLLRQVAMPAQIVAVLWVSRWEAFVALGHSRRWRYSGIGRVYNLATGRIVCDVPGPGYALSAVRTKAGVSVYTSHSVLMEFQWTPEAAPKPSAEVLASLNVTYPPCALR